TRWPDEWVVVGGHRDAWGPGARDNVSGTVSVLETARAFATLAKDGQRPARTVVFATWDAEEWGLIGSTEWGERLGDTPPGRPSLPTVSGKARSPARTSGAVARHRSSRCCERRRRPCLIR